MRVRLMFTTFVILGMTIPSHADWSDCASSLTKLHGAARDASGYAEGLENSKREAEEEKKKLDNCRRYPEMYDLFSDGCETARGRSTNAQNSYKSALSQFAFQLEEVRSHTKKVESSCADSDGTRRLDPRTLCTLLKQMRKEYSDAEILEACKTQAEEVFCRSCLGLP